MQNRESIRASVFWNLLTIPAQIVLGVIGSAVIARGLGPAGRGLWTLLLSLSGWAVQFSTFGLDTATAYRSARGDPIGSLVKNGLRSVLLCTAFAWAGAGVLSGWIFELVSKVGTVPAGYFILLAFHVPAQHVVSQLNCIFAGKLKYRVTALTAIASRSTEILGAFILIFLWKAGPEKLVPNALVSYALSIAVLTLLLLRAWPCPRLVRSEPGSFKEMSRYGLPAYLSGIVTMVNYRSDVYLVTIYCGAASLGIYTVATALSEMLWYVPQALSTVSFSHTAASTREGRGFSRRAVKLSLAFAAILAVLLTITGRFLISAVYGRAFSGALRPLLFLLPGTVLMAGTKPLAAFVAGKGGIRLNLLSSTFGAVVNFGCNLMLIPKFGIAGAAVSSSISYSIAFVFTLFFALRLSKRDARIRFP